jgi:hypothetical protein
MEILSQIIECKTEAEVLRIRAKYLAILPGNQIAKLYQYCNRKINFIKRVK